MPTGKCYARQSPTGVVQAKSLRPTVTHGGRNSGSKMALLVSSIGSACTQYHVHIYSTTAQRGTARTLLYAQEQYSAASRVHSLGPIFVCAWVGCHGQTSVANCPHARVGRRAEMEAYVIPSHECTSRKELEIVRSLSLSTVGNLEM